MRYEEAKAIIDALVKLRESATDEQALEVPVLYPTWREGVEYESGQRVLHGGVLYGVLQNHTSQADWTPEAAPSLFAKVLTSDDGAPLPWEQPGADNAYMKGDKVTYNGEVWVSCMDYNTHEPTEQNEVLGIWARV